MGILRAVLLKMLQGTHTCNSIQPHLGEPFYTGSVYCEIHKSEKSEIVESRVDVDFKFKCSKLCFKRMQKFRQHPFWRAWFSRFFGGAYSFPLFISFKYIAFLITNMDDRLYILLMVSVFFLGTAQLYYLPFIFIMLCKRFYLFI